MITVNNVSLSFDGTTLFSDVNLKFTPGNCYGIIGANGAGKSTFLKILSGVKEPTTGEIIIPANVRMSVLKQDHYAYDEYTVMEYSMPVSKPKPCSSFNTSVSASQPFNSANSPSSSDARIPSSSLKSGLA